MLEKKKKKRLALEVRMERTREDACKLVGKTVRITSKMLRRWRGRIRATGRAGGVREMGCLNAPDKGTV